MSFTEKIDVLELLLNLLKENETKLETLIEKIETVEHTVTQNPKLSKTLKEYDPTTTTESLSQNILIVDDDKHLANSFKLILELHIIVLFTISDFEACRFVITLDPPAIEN